MATSDSIISKEDLFILNMAKNYIRITDIDANKFAQELMDLASQYCLMVIDNYNFQQRQESEVSNFSKQIQLVTDN